MRWISHLVTPLQSHLLDNLFTAQLHLDTLATSRWFQYVNISTTTSLGYKAKHAKGTRLRKLLESDKREVYGDKVLACIFHCQRDKCINCQIDSVESVLRNIQRDIQILHETLAHVQ